MTSISQADGDAGDTTLVELEFFEHDVALITLNRPEQRNAMNRAARRQLFDALAACTGKAKAIILTGNGPAFCAGIDLKESRSDRLSGRVATSEDVAWGAVQDAIRHHSSIVIAAVNGYALGGGVTLVNSSDLAIAADTAEFGMPEVGLGLYASFAGPTTQLKLSPKRSAWMLLTGERITGRLAADWGLVNRSVGLDLLRAEALALAGRIASFDAVTLAWCKKALWEIPMHITDWSEALEFGARVNDEIRSRSRAGEHGLDTFARGDARPGQGASGGARR